MAMPTAAEDPLAVRKVRDAFVAAGSANDHEAIVTLGVGKGRAGTWPMSANCRCVRRTA
jgi:hypothetical protein